MGNNSNSRDTIRTDNSSSIVTINKDGEKKTSFERSKKFQDLCIAYCADDEHGKSVQEMRMANQVIECVCLEPLEYKQD